MTLKTFKQDIEEFLSQVILIRKSWKPFLVLLVLSIYGIWHVFDWRYSGVVDNLNEHIKTLEGDLKSKNETLDEYRERLDIVRPTQPSYSVLTNEELRKKGTLIIKNVRDLIAWDQQTFKELMNSSRKEINNAKTKEKKHEINERYSNLGDKLNEKLISEYDQKYKVDLILIRDEAWSRIPEAKRSGIKQPRDMDVICQFPRNYLGMEACIDHCEGIIRLLP